MPRRKKQKTIEKEVSSEKPKIAEETFCYPDYGIAVKATNKEEADEKLKEILDKNEKKNG